MPRRNRQRRPARPAPHIDPKPVMLVVCEGRNSEPEYVQGFVDAYRNPRVKVECLGGQGVPRSVVECARDRKQQAEREAVRKDDEFDDYRHGYELAVARAARLDESAREDGEPGRNPSTGVYVLTERIRKETE